MVRSLLTVFSGTLSSRLLGFVRDAMIASLLGAGAIADAFLVAFQLVNVVRRLLAEGALNAALIPAWMEVRDKDGATAAIAFAGRVLGTITTALIVATALLGLLMPLVIALIAPGFAGRPALELAINDARLMLPYLAFAGPVTVMMGLLNAQGRFALTAFSPLLFNVSLIAVMIVLVGWRADPEWAAIGLAATIGVAGLLQLSILLLRGGSGGLASPFRPTIDAEMRGFLVKAGPGMVATAGPQLLIVAAAVIASHSPSAVSWLYFANRLIELPLGIVGVAIGSVLIPELTRAVRGEDRTQTTEVESRGLELALGLSLPATLGLIVLSEPIVRVLFQHGVFTDIDTAATAQALAWLSLALPAHVLVKALSPAFFARGDTVTPLFATLIALIATVLLAMALGWFFGASGVAAGLAAGAWSNALVLVHRGLASFGFSIDAAACRRLPKIAAASLGMGTVLWLILHALIPLAGDQPGFAQALILGVLIVAGGAVYAGLLMLLGGFDWRETRQALRRPGLSDLRD